MSTKYEIVTRDGEHDEWRTDSIGDLNEFDTEALAWEGIEELKLLGPEWKDTDYDVRPVGDSYVVTTGVELSSTDLRDIAYIWRRGGPHRNRSYAARAQTATVQVADADGSVDGPWLCGEALYLPSAGRIGIAWGADAVWADAESLDDGIRMYMVDPEEFEARN